MTAEEFYNEWITNRFGLNDKGEVHRWCLSVNTQNELMEAYAEQEVKAKLLDFCKKAEDAAKEFGYLVPSNLFVEEYLNKLKNK